jgi:hypothetical protein
LTTAGLGAIQEAALCIERRLAPLDPLDILNPAKIVSLAWRTHS